MNFFITILVLKMCYSLDNKNTILKNDINLNTFIRLMTAVLKEKKYTYQSKEKITWVSRICFVKKVIIYL